MPTKDNHRLVHKVAIYGYAGSSHEDQEYKDAFAVSAYLAQQGYAIVNGGGPGVMEAATNGAESVNGDTLTVTLEPRYAPGFEEKYLGNQPDVEIKTSNYIERMFTLMAESDFYVICNGGTGTLSELGTAWCLARLYQGRHKGIVLYGDFWREIVDVLKKNMRIRPDAEDVITICTTPEQVYQAILEYEVKMANNQYNFPDAGEEAAFMAGDGKNE